jgi:hypothetical protein
VKGRWGEGETGRKGDRKKIRTGIGGSSLLSVGVWVFGLKPFGTRRGVKLKVGGYQDG